MHEYPKIGDAVRIYGQRGRPSKWIVSSLYCGVDDSQVKVTYYLNPALEMLVDPESIAPYKEYVKKEKVMEVI